MAEIFVQHTLNSRKIVKFNIHLREYALKGEEGDIKWLLEVGTLTPATTGQQLAPRFINNVTYQTIEVEIEKAIAKLCTYIDWSDFDVDRYPPLVTYFSPQGADVPIKSPVKFRITDELPSAGIDLSGLKVSLNNGTVDFDITSEVTIKGDPYEYNFTWLPPNING